MSRMSKLVRYFTDGRGRDLGFETYYGSLIMRRSDGVPTAAEARRDYESVRRLMDRAIVY